MKAMSTKSAMSAVKICKSQLRPPEMSKKKSRKKISENFISSQKTKSKANLTIIVATAADDVDVHHHEVCAVCCLVSCEEVENREGKNWKPDDYNSYTSFIDESIPEALFHFFCRLISFIMIIIFRSPLLPSLSIHFFSHSLFASSFIVIVLPRSLLLLRCFGSFAVFFLIS